MSLMVHGFWQEGSSNDQLHDKLEQALQEVESSNRKAFEESDRRVKAEINAAGAMRRVMSSAILPLFPLFYVLFFAPRTE